MSLQPGVGYSFSASSHGTTLDVNPVWSQLVPNSFGTIPDGGDGGGDQVPPNKVIFSKMRVICRTAGVTGTPTGSNARADLPENCLREYNLTGMAVYPTGSKTAATTPNTDLLDNGATFTLVPPSGGATTKEYAFCVILNQYNYYAGTLAPGVPYAALMEVGGDAYTKTTPWGSEDGCDFQRFLQYSRWTLLSIPNPSDPYDPELATRFWATHFINTESFDAMQYYLQNYNCQRLRIATVSWDNTNSKWVLTQHLLGPITIPYNIFFAGESQVSGTDPDPTWLTIPQNATEQAAWEGAYTGSTKWDGTGTSPTAVIPV
jgi:hypothetical protein